MLSQNTTELPELAEKFFEVHKTTSSIIGDALTAPAQTTIGLYLMKSKFM